MTAKTKTVLGMRIKGARLAKGLTQEELADAIGRTAETISNIERGKNAPGVDTVYAICKVLGLAFADLLEVFEQRSTGRRAELEAAGIHFLRSLDDGDLDVAVKQLEALAKRKR